MEARDGALHFEVQVAERETLSHTKMIIEDHIVRFAHREKLTRLDWQEIE